MDNTQKVTEILFKALDEINEMLPLGRKVKKSLETVLFGPSGELESLELLNLIVAVEEKLKEEFARTITLIDETVVSFQDRSFASVQSLKDYILSLVEEK